MNTYSACYHRIQQYGEEGVAPTEEAEEEKGSGQWVEPEWPSLMSSLAGTPTLDSEERENWETTSQPFGR